MIRSRSCSPSEPGRTPAAKAALLVLGLLGVGLARPDQAQAAPPDTAELPSDTVLPTRLRLFERRLLPSTEYLRRAFDARTARNVAEFGTPETFARRYRISDGLASQIFDAAIAEGIDPELAFRVVRVESVFQADARGPTGALGLMQLMPSTARSLDRSLRSESQILEPTTNLRVGLRYLRSLIHRYDGDVRLGILAYNRGEGAVDRALRSGRDPENGYSAKVLGTVAAPTDYEGRGVIER